MNEGFSMQEEAEGGAINFTEFSSELFSHLSSVESPKIADYQTKLHKISVLERSVLAKMDPKIPASMMQNKLSEYYEQCLDSLDSGVSVGEALDALVETLEKVEDTLSRN